MRGPRFFRRAKLAGAGASGHGEDGALKPGGGHGHSHGTLDPAIVASQRGIWATKISLLVLLATAAVQAGVVLLTGSVALLADTVHNFGDAATAVPLWVAFSLAQRKPSRRFTYGYGRAEDLAGLLIVATIVATGGIAGYKSILRLVSPTEVSYIWAVAAAALAGFLGNEWVALFRMRVGREIGSTALVADGHHARVDGLTSLAVFLGAIGVWFGFPLADPIVGLAISAAVFRIAWQSGKAVFARLLDGVDPEMIDEVRHAAAGTPGVREVSQVRVRWLGHRLLAEVNVAVQSDISVEQGHQISQEVHQRLLDHLRYLSNATIHVDPAGASGEEHHPRDAVGQHHSAPSPHVH